MSLDKRPLDAPQQRLCTGAQSNSMLVAAHPIPCAWQHNT